MSRRRLWLPGWIQQPLAQTRAPYLPCTLLLLVPLGVALPSPTHPVCSSCPPSYWSPADSHQIHFAPDSHFSGSSFLQPQGRRPNSNRLPSSALWWQRPCLECPADPRNYFPLPAVAVSLSYGSREHIVLIWSKVAEFRKIAPLGHNHLS